MSKYIFITGGVISGVGKGVASASIGKILKEHGFSVTAIKIDPYLNFDAGTLRPTEHGEVWVTSDGGEIDQDLGNYERFLEKEISKKNNITTGQIYKNIIEKERKGEYLGKTVEYIPHVIDEIKNRIKESANGYDFVIVEIGGTVGDYQVIPYLFTIKNMEIELGKDNIINILVSYFPLPSHMGEMKTKPTQQSISMLNEQGIFPDFILCRAANIIDDDRKRKIQMHANIPYDCIISAPNADTIYKVPLNYEKDELGKKILKRFNIVPKKIPDWSKWEELVKRIENPNKNIKIAIVGKYVNTGKYTLKDSYISINHALEHAGLYSDSKIEIAWVDSDSFVNGSTEELNKYNGIIVPGGFGNKGVEGKINVIKYCRENNIPYLGLCYGMQLAIVEFARNVCNLNANTTEIDENTPSPVINLQKSQEDLMKSSSYGGTMRLGSYTAILKKSKILTLYEKTGRLEKDMKKIPTLNEERKGLSISNAIIERHRHRFEVNPDFISDLENKGMIFSGYHERTDGTKLMEFIELENHKFFIATQAHPEFKSTISDPSPLFLGFVEACK